MRNILLILIFMQSVITCFAQQKTHLIKANSFKVSIKEGDLPVTGNWDYLSTTLKPVVYNVSKLNKSRRLIFYTDIDSLSINISPNKKFDFKVLLHSKDTCYVQISTIVPSYYKTNNNREITNDTIPFTLGNDQYIHINGHINNSASLDFIFDTGASCVLLTETGLKKVNIKLDGLTENQGSGGVSTEKTSSTNHLQLSKLEWKNLPLLFIDYKGSLKADGVIGFNVFEDKSVEIDYDKNLLIIHSRLQLNKTGYAKLNMRHDMNGSFIRATLNNGKRESTGWFLFDTGGNLTVTVGGDFSIANKLYGTMKNLGNSVIGGTGKQVITSENVLLPGLKLVNFEMPNVPILLQESNSNYSGNAGIIGNSVLKRFNTIIDYPNATIYLRPNSLFNTSFDRKDTTKIFLISVVIILAMFLIGFGYYRKRK